MTTGYSRLFMSTPDGIDELNQHADVYRLDRPFERDGQNLTLRDMRDLVVRAARPVGAKLYLEVSANSVDIGDFPVSRRFRPHLIQPLAQNTPLDCLGNKLQPNATV